MDIAAIVALVAPILWKAVDFVKFARAREWNGVITQSVVWVGGIVLVLLLAQTDYAAGITLGSGQGLDTLNIASQIWIGLTLGATTSIGYDFLKAVDNTNSAITPQLVSGARQELQTSLAELTATPVVDNTVTNNHVVNAPQQPLDYTVEGGSKPASS